VVVLERDFSGLLTTQEQGHTFAAIECSKELSVSICSVRVWGSILTNQSAVAARSSPVSTFDDNNLMRASLDVLPSLSDRELEFDWQDGDMDSESDAD
jgi:hypothetical protein